MAEECLLHGRLLGVPGVGQKLKNHVRDEKGTAEGELNKTITKRIGNQTITKKRKNGRRGKGHGEMVPASRARTSMNGSTVIYQRGGSEKSFRCKKVGERGGGW